MTKKSKKILIVSMSILSVVAIVAAIVFPVLFVLLKNPNNYTYSFDEQQKNYTMNVAVDEDKISLSLESEADVVGTGTAKLVSMKAYEYYSSDDYKGLSTSVTDGTLVGEYELGTQKSFEIERYDATEYDRLYDKYYLIGSDNKILKGPIYATDITPRYKAVPQLKVTSKKGVLADDEFYINHDGTYVSDLGATNVVVNLPINMLFYPNESYDDSGNLVPATPPTKDFKAFISNGKTYYFRESGLIDINNKIKQYYKRGYNVTAIIVAANGQSDKYFPRDLTYYPWSRQGTACLALNTSNELGFGYYIALMEYMAKHHSVSKFRFGYASTFVIGNEIDYAMSYNRISEKQADFNVYMEEYSRLLWLSNLAVKKYCASMNVATSFTHAFAKEGITMLGKNVQTYAPKYMMDWLNSKSKFEGDYDWGIAAHPYCSTLSTSSYFEYDTQVGINGGTITNDFNTPYITFSNIEVLDKFLSQTDMQYNGKTRSIYLTEGGVSSSGYYGDGRVREDEATAENIQAGIIAALWYKVSQIDSIKCFNYYRLIDHMGDGGEATKFGLINNRGKKKPSYEVWKYIDTQYSMQVSNKYLGYIKYYDRQGVKRTATSYMELLDFFGTNYFTIRAYDWSKATPAIIPENVA